MQSCRLRRLDLRTRRVCETATTGVSAQKRFSARRGADFIRDGQTRPHWCSRSIFGLPFSYDRGGHYCTLITSRAVRGARCPSAAWAERRRTARRPGRTPGRRPEPSRAPPTRRAAIHAPPRDFTSIQEAAAEAAAAGVTTTPQSTARAAGAGSTRRVCWTRNMCAASPPTLPALRRNDNFSRTPCAVAVQI